MYLWYTDALMLDAMNVRGLPRSDATPAPDLGATVQPDSIVNIAPQITPRDLTGDLTASAARLGVPVADLVKMRLRLWPARRSTLLARIFARRLWPLAEYPELSNLTDETTPSDRS